jgi:D-alanine transaminase
VERNLRRDELSKVDEIFLSGTTTEVLPVTRIDGQPVGNGAPGPLTKRLRLLYNREAQIHGV